MTQDPASPRDYRKEVTNKLIELLEQGVAPWQQPWKAVGSVRMPYNPTSGKAYRGGNALYLLVIAIDRGLNDPRWITYKQAAENGWRVRRGERGTQIEFWDMKPVRSEDSAKTSDEDQETQDSPQNRLIHRIYTGFNAGQIAGIPPLEPHVYTPFEVVEAGESILVHSGAVIVHDQRDRAFYDRKRDAIHLPNREFFEDAAGYYGTALHELAHWSGHPSRLNRATLTDAYRFGDLNYAKEELRAEIASLFPGGRAGYSPRAGKPRRLCRLVDQGAQARQERDFPRCP